MSIFEISVLNLKKMIHFIHFGVRPADLCEVTFMLWVGDAGVVTWRPLCCGFIKMVENVKKGIYSRDAVCLNSWMGIFGDV